MVFSSRFLVLVLIVKRVGDTADLETVVILGKL